TIDVVNPIDISAIDISVLKTTAEVGGSTSVYVDEGAVITAGSLEGTADSDNDASILSFAFLKIDAIDIAALSPKAKTDHATAAFVGPSAGIVSVFDPDAAVSDDPNTIRVGHMAGLSDGDAVVYDSGGGAPIKGLT